LAPQTLKLLIAHASKFSALIRFSARGSGIEPQTVQDDENAKSKPKSNKP